MHGCHGQRLTRCRVRPRAFVEGAVALHLVPQDGEASRNGAVGLIFRELQSIQVVVIGFLRTDLRAFAHDEDGSGILGVGIVDVAHRHPVAVVQRRVPGNLHGNLVIQLPLEIVLLVRLCHDT